MSKKKPEENQNAENESLVGATKPVRATKRVFKDKPISESERVVQADNEVIEETIPVKKTRSTKSAAKEPVMVEGIEDVVEAIKPKKTRRGKWVWLGILMMLVITAIGSGVGYKLAMDVRNKEEISQRIELATTQYVMAEQDQKNGNLSMARQRLEYILTIYPDYPGLSDKLTEVMIAINLAQPPQPTSEATKEPVVTAVPTKDTQVVSELYTQARAQYAAKDWQGLLATIEQMRNIDPSYEPLAVDGMYYYALRNNGVIKIQQGHHEVGLYYLAMAEKIAPLDAEVENSRYWAQTYLIAGSWYGVNYTKAAELFYTLYQQMPNMLDINGFTAKQRYVGSLEGIGDTLMLTLDYCGAATQYASARDILSNEKLLVKIQQAQDFCANPPATPTPTVDPNAPTPTEAPPTE